MQTRQHPKTPAKPQPQSQAAAAQRLVDRPSTVPHGFCYDIPHRPLHSRRWHLRRHLKRKRLRSIFQRYAAADRLGTRWSMLPIACVILALVAAIGSLLVGYTSLSAAVGLRYQGDIATLVDILPKDSLRMYAVRAKEKTEQRQPIGPQA